MHKHKTIKPSDISTDDLWFAARYDVVVDREGISGLDRHFSSKERILASALLTVILHEKQFDAEYNDILECVFESYDNGSLY